MTGQLSNTEKSPSFEFQSRLTLESTLADLPTHDFKVAPYILGELVAETFKQDPELPGVIIAQDSTVLGAFSRRRFLEQVGRPYGVELYLKRPINVILKAISPIYLQLPSDTPIHEATRKALSRPFEQVYEPVVVEYPDLDDENSQQAPRLCLLNIYNLLLAQSHLLTLANHTIEARAEELERLNADKDKFFSIISHDLKAPFQPLLGMSELLPYLVDAGNQEDIKTAANGILRSSKTVYSLLETLLEWSLVQRGKIPYKPEPLLLAKTVQYPLSLLADKANQKEITLLNEVSPDYKVYADQNLLDTVVRNLVSNALKFTHRGGTVYLSAISIDNLIQLSVIDNGVGMSEEQCTQLFVLGKNRSTLGTDDEQGTGLGLTLCKDMVEKNQGNIWVESQLGQGTTFTFTIPQA